MVDNEKLKQAWIKKFGDLVTAAPQTIQQKVGEVVEVVEEAGSEMAQKVAMPIIYFIGVLLFLFYLAWICHKGKCFGYFEHRNQGGQRPRQRRVTNRDESDFSD